MRTAHFELLFAHFLAFGREYELLDINVVRLGSRHIQHATVGIGAVEEKWVFLNCDVSSSTGLISLLHHECIAKEDNKLCGHRSPCRLGIRWADTVWY